MKFKNSLAFMILAGFILSPCGIASAEEQSYNPSKEPWLGPKADQNQDGKIDDVEKQQAREIWKKNHPKKEKMRDNADANGDGAIDSAEKQQAIDKWKETHGTEVNKPQEGFNKDKNPPGMAGGPGTNWENKPGPQGGPGASPNKGGGGNPPGPKGGPGGGKKHGG